MTIGNHKYNCMRSNILILNLSFFLKKHYFSCLISLASSLKFIHQVGQKRRLSIEYEADEQPMKRSGWEYLKHSG